MLARQIRDLQVRLHSPFAWNVFLQRLVDALEYPRDTDGRVACDIEGRERSDRPFPHLRPDFLQPEDDVEQAAVFQAERPRPGPQRTQEEKAAVLLILLRERRRRLIFRKAACEIAVADEIILIGVVFADECHAQRCLDLSSINPGRIWLLIEISSSLYLAIRHWLQIAPPAPATDW